MSFSEAKARDISRAPNIAANAAFVPIGIVTVLLGPMLPILSARWSLSYGQAGSLFTAQFVASTFAVLLSGVLVSRLGFRFAINAGLLAMAAPLAVLSLTPYSLGVACIALYGAGLGLAVPAANLLVAEVNPRRRSGALNLLNFSWSVGAVACPFLVAASARGHHIALFLLSVSGSLLFVMFGIMLMPWKAAEQASKSGNQPIDWRTPALAVLCLLFFLYVGAENAFGGWVASYAKSLSSFSPSRAVMTPSFFYSALMAGRWIAPYLLRTIDEIKLARGGLVVTCVGMGCLLLSRSVLSVTVSVAIAGFGCSSVYPITIALLAREFGVAASRVGSVMFTLGNVGGASLPWLVGYSSDRFGSLKVGLAVPLVATVAMYGLYTFQWGGTTRQTKSESDVNVATQG